MASRKRYVYALIVVIPLHSPDGVWAAESPLSWRSETPAGPVEAAIRRTGRSESLVVSLRPAAGIRIDPPVLRLDPPALARGRMEGRFPATVRAKRAGGPLEAVIPLTGGLLIADPDRNDGMLRVEFRYCGEAAGRCSVGRAEVPLRVSGKDGAE